MAHDRHAITATSLVPQPQPEQGNDFLSGKPDATSSSFSATIISVSSAPSSRCFVYMCVFIVLSFPALLATVIAGLAPRSQDKRFLQMACEPALYSLFAWSDQDAPSRLPT
jgi:hypothetical protein